MRKPAFCICENKDAAQLRGYREADRRLCAKLIGAFVFVIRIVEGLYRPVCVGPGRIPRRPVFS